ncbi:MAG: Fur family transcriptional regulator [Planctomycetota bacterium]
MTQKLIEKLKAYVQAQNLRWTHQRQIVAMILFDTRQHLTTDELYQKAKQQDPAIGYATVSRTLHLLTEAGFCDRIDFSDGSMRYEVLLGREHHDHLICTRCGVFIEIYSAELEEIQTRVVRQHRFRESYHKLQIFGICEKCSQTDSD